MPFFENSSRYSAIVLNAMENVFVRFENEVGLSVPTVPPEHLQKLRLVCSSGGKMVRPTLACLIYEGLSRNKAEDVAVCAAALEMFHNYTLIHDDIYDEDRERRGMPTAHSLFETEFRSARMPSAASQYADSATRYGCVQGTIAGKILFTLGMDAILNAPVSDSVKIRLLRKYADVSVWDNVGQALDLEYETAAKADVTNYEKLAILKTGKLLRTSAEFGAVLAGADDLTVRQVGDYAENVAIAFQIKDDLLDLGIGGSKGREIGSDIRKGKKTLPYTYLLSLRPDFAASADFGNAVGNPNAPPEAISAVVETMHECGALEMAESDGLSRVEAAKEELRLLSDRFPAWATNDLIEFTDYVWERKK